MICERELSKLQLCLFKSIFTPLQVFGKNNITLSIASAGVVNKSEFTVYREKIGDTQRIRDFQDYTGGHNTSNLAIRKGSLVSSALTTKHENETEIKLPDNIISIKVED